MTPNATAPETNDLWPALPTETEIYILPNGEIVVADLPAELAASLAHLTQRHEVEDPIESVEQKHPNHVTDQQHPTQPT